MDPLGIDERRPRFSWELFDDREGSVQSAYRVVVATSRADLDDERDLCWDSGRVESAEQFSVVYSGAALSSATRYHWKVRVWDRDGRASIWSQPALFETALQDPDDWQAHWIDDGRELPLRDEDFYGEDPAPLFRKSFAVAGRVERARLYISGLGNYLAFLNGERLGDREIDPGWTEYRKRVFYSTYDVTEHVRPGDNALGVTLGNGWFNPLPMRMWGWLNLRDYLRVGRPCLIARLVVDTDSGREVVTSDESWRVQSGPVRKNSVYLGESYDARMEVPNWSGPELDDGDWSSARRVEPALGPLQAQALPPVRELRRLRPVELTEPTPGVFVFDFGENVAGWASLSVRAERGTAVALRYGELLHPDGTLNVHSSLCGQIRPGGEDPGPGAPPLAFQGDTYVCRGGEVERWTPQFGFRGFRYVEWSGTPDAPDRESLEAVVLSADLEPVGEFACSNELFNEMQAAVERTFRSNLFSVQSDCPHREKFGYGGDIVATYEAVSLLYDTAQFYAKTVQDFADAARPGGGLTETAPFVGVADRGFGAGTGPIGWASAFLALQKHLLEAYGDRRVLERQDPPSREWIQFLRGKAENHLFNCGLSDWGSIDHKPHAVTSSSYYYWNVRVAGRIARELGDEERAAELEALAAEVRSAFQAAFYRAGTGEVERHNQVCQAHALALELVPAEERELALEVLVREIVEHRRHHFATGFKGTRLLLDVLTEMGRSELVYRVLNQTSFPGIGHMLARGATTLLESWDTTDDTSSQNHPAYGSVTGWFFQALGGLRQAPDSRAWSHVLVRPRVVGDLRWVHARHDCIRGRIEVNWERRGDSLYLHVELPPNTRGTIEVPSSRPAEVTIRGSACARSEASSSTVFEVGSGEYSFAAPLTTGRPPVGAQS